MKISTLLLLIVLLFFGFYYFKCKRGTDSDDEGFDGDEDEYISSDNVTPLYIDSLTDDGEFVGNAQRSKGPNTTPIDKILPNIDMELINPMAPPQIIQPSLAGNVRPDNIMQIDNSYTFVPQ